jgi:hypothetical protein
MVAAPSLNVTVPVAVAGETVAVNVTGWPKTDGLADEASVVVVLAFAVNVAVIAGLLPVTVKLQGLVVPEHPVMLVAELQPLKNDPELAFAVNVPVALLLLKFRALDPVQLLLIVTDVVLF